MFSALLATSSRGAAARQRLQAALRPRTPCAVCRQWNPSLVCADCRTRFAPDRPRCARCAAVLGVAAARCGECLGSEPPWRAAWCAVDYGFPWDRLLADLKFHDRPELAGALVQLLVPVLRQDGAAERVDLIVPVPLAPARERARGYNQSWELARRLAAALALPAAPALLERLFDRAAQAALGREERARNLAGGFVAAGPAAERLRGRRVALVDDVMTTGATAREAAAALHRGGATAVDLWVFARTPAPGAG